MSPEKRITFGEFRLDLVNECLWRGSQAIALAPKEYAVLLYLVRNPGRLIMKDELIEAVWPETVVTDGVLKVSVRKLRAVLDDDHKSPQFIETAHRRGYRFIGLITDGEGKPARGETGRLAAPRPLRLVDSAEIDLVGRDVALAQMSGYLERARGGDRQVIFVTGEAGIGKTTLVEAFLQSVARNPKICVAQGQCLEQYGKGEAYLPVLEAMSRLCQEQGRKHLVELLYRQAPTWLLQMPWLTSDPVRERLQREVIGATHERMMREMAEALEAVASESPLILVLEDLHWSDYSTLDLVSYLARRRTPAQLFLIATYRPVEVALSEHPLKGVKQDLQAHRQCEELPLEYLSREAISDYLAARFPRHGLPAAFAELLHERTEGNPFFLINAIDYLQEERVIAEVDGLWQLTVAIAELEMGVPENIRQMIEKQIERLDREQQRLLEVASVAGNEFPLVAIAAGCDQDLMRVEEHCEELERRHQFLRATGVSTLPNGMVTARYGFIHSLYQEVLYDRIAAGRRARLHLLIGERGEEIYGELASDVAAELAMHFEQGYDYRRAVKHLQQAAQNHYLRYANREAIDYLTHALALVAHWPESERAGARIVLLEQTGLARLAMGDMEGAAGEFETLAEYAKEQGRMEDGLRALDHLTTALSWVDRERCLGAAEWFMTLSRGLTNELLQSHARGCWGYWQVLFLKWDDEHAKALSDAVASARQAGDHQMLGLHLARHGFFDALRSDYLGTARATEEAAQLALESSDAHSFLLAQFFQAWGLLHQGQWGEMRRILDHGLEMADRNEHHRWAVLYRLELAWLHEQAFDFQRAREICEQAHEQARKIHHPYTESLGLILLGRAYLGLEQDEAAIRCFNDVALAFDRERSLMDWILRIPLHLALSRYWLDRGQTARAHQEAERVCELAAQPGERTYLALAYQMLAEIEMAEQKWSNAKGEVSRALMALDGVDAPLAEWRVCETAAKISERLGDGAEATRYWRRSAETLKRLADSLSEDDYLRESLTTNPAVQEIQKRARDGMQATK